MTIDILWRKENAYPCTHTFLSALCNQSGYQPILFVGELSDDHKSTNTHRSSYFLCEYVHCSYTITHLHIIYRHIIPCKRYCHNMYVIYIYIHSWSILIPIILCLVTLPRNHQRSPHLSHPPHQRLPPRHSDGGYLLGCKFKNNGQYHQFEGRYYTHMCIIHNYVHINFRRVPKNMTQTIIWDQKRSTKAQQKQFQSTTTMTPNLCHRNSIETGTAQKYNVFQWT